MSAAGPTVGWVGLGAIGLPMAARAAAVGFTVSAWDPVAERREAAAARGVGIAADAAATGAAGGLVVCVVRDAEQVADSLLGERGALAAGGRVGVVMSSVGAETMAALAARAPAGTVLLDAPILGNATGAEAGTLTVPLSGPAAAKAEAAPLLASFADSIVDLGEEPGSAQTVKAVSQQLQILNMVAALEAISLARARGVEEERMLEIVAATEPTWASRNWDYAKELWRAGDPDSSLGLFAKDLAAALEDAAAAGVEMPLADRALDLLRARLEADPVPEEQV